MNHIAAALLLSLAGKKIDQKGIEEILNAAGSKANPAIIENIVSATKGKKPEQIISEGIPKLASSSGVSVSSGPVETKSDEKKEENEQKEKLLKEILKNISTTHPASGCLKKGCSMHQL